MKPDDRFLRQPKSFWANVRSISEQVGYSKTINGQGIIVVPTLAQMRIGLAKNQLGSTHLMDGSHQPNAFGQLIHDYFMYRADLLNKYVEPRLMNAAKANEVYTDLVSQLGTTRPCPMNKQKGEKAKPSFFTGIINALIEANIGDLPCDYDPHGLTSVTRDGAPLRTLARRVDGAFPRMVNPIAVWEIKEYYYTTTFGSRVADGVYESLLDGLELEELREHESIDVKHYLMVDAHYTWWIKGRSYLCRIIDMLHMGYIDEALFGYEVVERLPIIVKEWLNIGGTLTARNSSP